MIDEIRAQAEEDMEKAVEATRREMASIRTGRATTSLLDGIKVDYYGTSTPLNQMASIGVPEPRLMAIQPWDPNVITVIEKAILSSDLGLNPSNDGKIIRLSIPPLTEERRKDLVRLVKKIAEDGRVSIRNARRNGNEMLKEAQKEGEISEDDGHRAQETMQELTNEYIEKINQVLSGKEDEIMEV